MNIQNAFSAYGVNNSDKANSSPSRLGEALEKIGKNQSNKTDDARKASFSSVEAAFSAAEENLDSAQASEVYTKNQDNLKTSSNDDDDRTEAEKNQEKLEDSANKVTTDDMEALINEGYDVFGMTVDELSAAVERIKFQKELYADAIENQIEEKIETRSDIIAQAIKTLNNDPRAEKIAEKLMKANLPLTTANLTQMIAALDMGGNETTVSGSEAEYLIRNKLTPTLENISAARSASSTYQKAEKKLTDEAWNQLQPTVSHLLFQAGLRQSRDMMEAAQDFIKKDIPLTAENLKSYSQITKIRLSDDEILTRCADAISVGQDPKSANLLASTAKQVRQIIKDNDSVTDTGINYAVAKKAAQTGIYDAEKTDLSLSELHEAQKEVDNNAVVPKYLEDYSNSGVGNAASIKARRQLEEVKAKMTYEAGYRLAKEGIRIDSVSMNRLINDLRALENRYYSDFFKQSGAAPGSYTQNDVDLLRDTTEKLKEIENMPATLVYDTMDKGPSISVNELHAVGNATYGHEFSKFNQTFETVMTAPSGKYGDSMEKAFANVDSLLESAGIPVTEASRRATRILGYASAEINAENIEKVAVYDATLTDALTNLKPGVTVKMIRDGINPLNESLEKLNEKALQIKAEGGISEEDSFSNFLVNAEKKNDLTPEERDAYVAIYRALHQIQDSKDSALGNVFKAGTEPTLQGLLTAVRSGKITGRETIVNDTFENLSKINRDVDKIENKIRAGLSKPGSEDAEILNNLTESADNTIRELSSDTHFTADEWVKNLRDIAANGANATRFLEDFNILTSIENIDAAKDLLNADTTLMKNWKRFKTLATGETAELPDFIESMNSDEEIREAYQNFADETNAFKKEIQHDPSLGKIDVKALKKMDVGVKFMNRLSKRKFYSIPVETGNDIVNMNVTLVTNGEGSPSKVYASVPTEHLGTVSAEATIEDNNLRCFISSTSAEGMNVLKDRQLNLFAGLAENGVRINQIFYGAEEVPHDRYDYKTSGLYADTPEGAETARPENELYRIAKVFVTHVRQADNE